MRNLVLVVAVWALLWGVALILGVMPPIALPGEPAEPPSAALEASPQKPVEPDEPDEPDEAPVDAPRDEPGSDASTEEAPAPEPPPSEAAFIGPPAPEPAAAEGAPATAEGDASGPVCVGDASPRLIQARLPDGSSALLVDCGRHAELVVPDLSSARATVVAHFEYERPLGKVQAKDLTGDGRPDLAFAFDDRMVLLPTSPHGVWAAPTTLEGFTESAAPPARKRKRKEEGPAPGLVVDSVTYVVEARDGAFVLVASHGEAAPVVLRAARAALVYEANLE